MISLDAPASPPLIVSAPVCVIKTLVSHPTPFFSILFPHLESEINNEALKICLQALEEHTTVPYELLVVLDPPAPMNRIDPYKAWNIGLDFVKSPYMVFHNTDLIVGPKWDQAFAKHLAPDRILTNYLVEPGVLGCWPNNVNQNFGLCPRCFDRGAFDNFCRDKMDGAPEFSEGLGYYIQAVLPVEAMKRAGKFPDDMPFMQRSNDIMLFEKMVEQGCKYYRVNSWAYHFQNLTARRSSCSCYSQKSRRPGETP